MIRGVYASTSSLLALLRRQEILSHNLANMSTPGFKQEVALAETGPSRAVVQNWSRNTFSAAIGDLAGGVNGTQAVTDFAQGPLASSQRPLDLAITGEGFFRVQTPDGVRLTRDGTFHLDSAGQLVTSDGYYLLGEAGPIQLAAADPYIAEDGSIFVAGTNGPVARIALGRVQDLEGLTLGEDNLLDPGNQVVEIMPGGQAQLKQGFLEQANVDVSGTLVDMMLALRSYEATQRTLRLQDEALQRAMEIGRVG